jgi:hypothetical protein
VLKISSSLNQHHWNRNSKDGSRIVPWFLVAVRLDRLLEGIQLPVKQSGIEESLSSARYRGQDHLGCDSAAIRSQLPPCFIL